MPFGHRSNEYSVVVNVSSINFFFSFSFLSMNVNFKSIWTKSTTNTAYIKLFNIILKIEHLNDRNGNHLNDRNGL